MMKVIAKLDIPDSFDDTLKAKINEVANSDHFKPIARKNAIDYAKRELHAAYQLGLEQGKLEAIRELSKEVSSDE